ncbi:MAG: hypothetical protein CMN87_15530 [Stappia sp.]|uniref:hypothetical protein n=1 Tax=Stappia sp. TaxID=1870903 RepID=UPI000C6058F9|nr:hypothetical protein [Stappia sp.]MAA97805.1 hypothetical protein [Stappia sp.]MBM21416.1 hypothetical protein [Stappia sp.]|tara:strand:+ start:329 stop:532 length:204 start_codon:yes stop_codon:yes gene_type:complete
MRGWRTLIVNALVALLPILAEVLRWLDGFDWSLYLAPRDALWAMLIVGGLNIFLRRITRTPIGVGDA